MNSAMRNILVLGGTLEASALALALAKLGERAVLSYAGRVAQPRAQPIAVRVGGFGGVPGLVRHLREQGVTHLVDATHPFASQMSSNAVAACTLTGVPLLALTRAAWHPGVGDCWQMAADVPAAVAALHGPPLRVMLALGRMHLAAFAAQPQHHYILRLVDATDDAPPLPQSTTIVSRGPFNVASDIALMRTHRVDIVVCKNAGGTGAKAKLDAARSLNLPVVMVARPTIPVRAEVTRVDQVLQWLGHSPAPSDTSGGALRGV